MLVRRAIVLTVLLLQAALAGTSFAEPTKLVTPVAYGTHLPGLGEPALRLSKLIAERAGGTLALDLKQPGDGTKPHEILDKVASGEVDAGFATASFWAAEIPAAALFAGFPFGPDGAAYLAWFDRGNGRKLYQEMYDHAGKKVHVLPCAFGGAEAGGWFAKEVSGKDDLKRLRMRIFGLGARVMSRLGATTVLLPGSALLRAFERKEIDAAELYTPAVDLNQGLKDKVKLVYAPGWHQPETVLELLINKDRWNGLSDEQRAIIEDACRTTLQATLKDSAKLQADALAELGKEGLKVTPFPDDVLSALREAWREIEHEEGARDYFFKTVVDDIEKFRSAAPAQ
jgi:TRAP-type mannitol/chloroaromatic compound transport system substrate-binding protein